MRTHAALMRARRDAVSWLEAMERVAFLVRYTVYLVLLWSVLFSTTTASARAAIAGGVVLGTSMLLRLSTYLYIRRIDKALEKRA